MEDKEAAAWREQKAKYEAQFEPHTPSEVEACEVVKAAIRADMSASETATFGQCHITGDGDGERYSIALTINVPHTDEHGIFKLDTFYYADAKLDSVTHQMRAGSLIHN